MTPERWQEIDQMMAAALECEETKRSSFLAQACLDDDALRKEVESLLDHSDQARNFIESPPSTVACEALAERRATAMIGRTLGRYQILELLEVGGMGEVYRGRDTRLSRDVAIKILPQYLADDPEALKRFEREARAVAALSHSNILAIHDSGTEEGLTYAVMELLQGDTLQASLARSSLDWRRAVDVAVEIADGLAAAHLKGIIHRDLKPANIFLTADGGVKILDFGIARVDPLICASTEALPTEIALGNQSDLVLGTPGYMSPEQVRGEIAGVPSDIFSLGCILYEMLCGRRPFARGSVHATVAATLTGEPQPLAAVGVPATLDRLVRQCLQKDARHRPASAQLLATELRSIVHRASRTAPWNRWLLAAGWLGTSLAVILVVAIWRSSSTRPTMASILVLPMVNDGGDDGTDYLGGGITESIINNLSQLPKLRVVASSTSFRYQGRPTDPQQAGREVGADVVLTGRVRQQDGALTVQTALVKVADGSQVWGEQYHRKLSDVLAVQEEIAVAVSEKLRLNLSREERMLVRKRHTENVDAYQAYVMGRFFWNKRTEQGLKKATAFFQQAIDIDPKYALAYSGLADAYSVEVMYGYVPARSDYRKAKAAAKKALELDDTLAEAHTSLARASMFEWDWPASEREFKRALELNPGYPMAHQWYGQSLLIQGFFNEAIMEKKRGLDLDPSSLTAQASLAWAFFYAHQYEQSMAQVQKTLEMDPSFAMARSCLANLYEQKKMFTEAIAEWRKIDTSGGPPHIATLARLYALSGDRPAALASLNALLSRSKESWEYARSIAGVYVALGDRAHALEWLESDPEGGPLNLKIDPVFADLHPEPRFAAQLRRLKLAP